MKKIKKGTKVKVKWLDAAGDQSSFKSDIDNVPPKDLLVMTDSYGIFYKEDELAVLILHEESNEQCTWTVIPKAWLVSIDKLD